jgi:hypothetical protein
LNVAVNRREHRTATSGHSARTWHGIPKMPAPLTIPVVKMGGGYLRALLPNVEETVFGCDKRELLGRLKLRTRELRMHPGWVLDVNAIGGA